MGGPEHSILSNDAFPSREFDFMLSNPPYGKSWKTDLERMGGKKDMRDPRFVIKHGGDPEYSLVTRSSDGQMLFLANKLSKMKQDTPLGSRIAEVHNGSSLFTGDAGQGESNIRRWIIENDWLEAIVALPLNMFYNTGIATYVWVLTNRKPEHRKGKVQLIDATQWYQPLRKNLGKKNCELGEQDITRICNSFLDFKESEQSKIFDNAAFGYWKVTVERPLRIEGADPNRAYKAAEIKKLKESGERSKNAQPVIKRIHNRGTEPDPLCGLFEITIDGKPAVVEYEPDTDLRDTEQIPLQEEGGIEAFLKREVLPYAADAWYQSDSVKVGYEISFTRYFYKPQPMRTLAKSGLIFWRWRKKQKGCSARSSARSSDDRRSQALSYDEGLRRAVAGASSRTLGDVTRQVAVPMHQRQVNNRRRRAANSVVRARRCSSLFRDSHDVQGSVLRGLQTMLAWRLGDQQPLGLVAWFRRISIPWDY